MTGRGMTKLAGIVCAAAFSFVLDALVLDSQQAFAQAAPASQGAGPRFREDGPSADEFGRKEGYPSCKGLDYVNETRCRVGALSRYDTLFPARTIAAPKQSVPLARATSESVIRYNFAGLDLTLDDYLNRQPVTGFLIAKDNTILVERYQYDRTDTDRLTSFSMAKTVVSLLLGVAVKEGAIRSIDDLAETMFPSQGHGIRPYPDQGLAADVLRRRFLGRLRQPGHRYLHAGPPDAPAGPCRQPQCGEAVQHAPCGTGCALLLLVG